MEASLLAFSLARDSISARYREKKRYWRIRDEKRSFQSMVNVGIERDVHFLLAKT